MEILPLFIMTVLVFRRITALLGAASLIASLLPPAASVAQGSASLPDYAIENLFVAPATPEPGEETSFHASVRNVGSVRGSKRDFVQLWVDGIPSNDMEIVSGLPVGSTTSVQWGTTGANPPMPWTATSGSHTMRICLHQPTPIDTDEYQSDASSGNDCASLSFMVSGGATSSSSSTSSSSPVSPAPDYALQDLRFFQDTTGYAMTVVVRSDGAPREGWEQVRLDIDGIFGVMTYGIKPIATTGGTDTAVWSSSVLPPKNGWLPTEGTHTATACLDNAYWSPRDSVSSNDCKTIVFWMRAVGQSSSWSSSTSSQALPAASSASSASSAWSASSASGRSSAPSDLPDLIITRLRMLPATVTVQPSGRATYRFIATVKNTGAAKAGVSYARLEVQGENGEGGNEDTDWTMRTAAILPGRARNVTFRSGTRMSWQPSAGSFFATACANDESRSEPIAESDTDNDCSDELPFTVVGGTWDSGSSSSPASASSSSVSSRQGSSWSSSSAAGLADYVITNANFLSSISVGETPVLNALILNRAAPAAVPTTAVVTLENVTAGRIAVPGTFTVTIPPLTTGGRMNAVWSAADGSLTWRPAEAATYRAEICVNPGGASFPEEMMGNNCNSATLIVRGGSSASSVSSVSSTSSSSSAYSSSVSPSATTLPDYITSLFSPVSFTIGQPYVFEADIVNAGGPAMVGTRARLEIRKNQSISDVYYSGFLRAVPVLGSNGRQHVRWASDDVPASLQGWTPAIGTHLARICPDVDASVPESNYMNNCGEATVTVTAPTASSSSSSVASSASSSSSVSSASSTSSVSLPDLRIYSQTTQKGGAGKATILAAVRILFTPGTVFPQIPTTARLEYRKSGSDPWTPIGGDKTVAPFTRSGQYEVVEWYGVGPTATTSFPDGTYYFHVCADAGSQIPESSEVDNCSGNGFPLTFP